MARVLILGYGNPLRSDDGLGWQVAVQLFRTNTSPEVLVLPCHQLTPELAEPISRFSLTAPGRESRASSGVRNFAPSPGLCPSLTMSLPQACTTFPQNCSGAVQGHTCSLSAESPSNWERSSPLPSANAYRT